MGIAERKNREKAERRTLIMRCAKELILESGAEEVRMQDIAKKAELSKGTIYLYFPSKDILFQEICDEAGLHFIEYFQSRLRPDVSALEMFKLFWSSFLDRFGEGSELVMLFQMRRYVVPDYPFISLDDRKETSANHSYAIFDMIKGMIEQGIGEGFFEPDINPVIISHTVLSLFSLIIENAGRAGKEIRESGFIIEQMKSIFQILFRGFTREGINRSLIILER